MAELAAIVKAEVFKYAGGGFNLKLFPREKIIMAYVGETLPATEEQPS
jgi:hypothetical protein